MKKIACVIAICLFLSAAVACDGGKVNILPPVGADVADLSGLDEYGQETNIDYRYFWKPPQSNGYVGDPMPYYEDGVYSIFYLQDEGGSIRHSIYRVDTTDFIHYEYKGEVLRSGLSSTSQDYWIGTGSVDKAGEDYYFFYTGHNPNMESVNGGPWEKVLVAKSEGDLENFKKIEDFEIAPPLQYSQVDFRDPQAYFNESTGCFEVTVETNAGGIPLIVKFTVSLDLRSVTFDGIVYSDASNGFWNLECADITYQNGRYYMVYSGQPNDTVWYAVSNQKFSGYGEPRRLDGKHFYAAKIVEGDKGTFLVGWVYRRSGFTDTSDLYWGGHLVAHKMHFNDDGTISLTHPEGIEAYFGFEKQTEMDMLSLQTGKRKVGEAFESFLVQGSLSYSGKEKFGIVLGYGYSFSAYRYVEYDPVEQKLGYRIEGKKDCECEVSMALDENTVYDFTYIQEGSVGIFYIDGVAGGALSFRSYGTNNTLLAFFSEGSNIEITNLKQFLRSKES